MGLGIGQTTVVAPTYLAECAPRSIRGLCICIFSGCVYLGIMLGYFANFGTSLHISNTSSSQWIDATILHIIFAGIILIMSIFALESPRWLAKVGQDEKAAINMSKLRKLPQDHPYVRAELIDIHDQLEREREATLGSGFFGPLKELFVLRGNRYRICLGLGCQLMGRKQTIYIFKLKQILTMMYRVVRCPIYHDLCTTVFCHPRHDWLFRKALRNSHLRCCEIRFCAHLRFLPRWFHRTETLIDTWYHHPIHLHVIYRYLSDSGTYHHFWKNTISSSKTCRYRRHRNDLLLWRRLGFRLEQHPISHRCRNLSLESTLPRYLNDHVFPFRQPIR